MVWCEFEIRDKVLVHSVSRNQIPLDNITFFSVGSPLSSSLSMECSHSEMSCKSKLKSILKFHFQNVPIGLIPSVPTSHFRYFELQALGSFEDTRYFSLQSRGYWLKNVAPKIVARRKVTHFKDCSRFNVNPEISPSLKIWFLKSHQA